MQSFNTKKVIISFLAVLIFYPFSYANAVPKITNILLGSALGANTHIFAPDSTSVIANGCGGTWISGGETDSSDSTGTIEGACAQTDSTLFGVSTGYGMLVLSVDATDVAGDLNSMGTNYPTNANTAIFGAATGPVNKTFMSLDRTGVSAVTTGTTITFTIDMVSDVPHLVAVMGGTYPTVTYDSSGTGTLTIQTTTFDTTNQANDTFTSMVGFMIITDSSLGGIPLGIIAQTNAWVGDMFPLFPGMDSSAANSNIGGTLGSFTAKCGTTFYGPTGGTRTVNLFIPNSSLSTMFGSTDADGNAIDENSMTGYKGTAQAFGTVTTGAINFSTTGVKINFDFTFASAVDTSIGPAAAESTPVPTLSEWGMIIMLILLAGVGIYSVRRRTVSL